MILARKAIALFLSYHSLSNRAISETRKIPNLTTECENTRYRDNGATMAKKIPEGKAELSVYVDKELKLKFKVACTQQDKSMGDVVNELIEDWLAQNQQKS